MSSIKKFWNKNTCGFFVKDKNIDDVQYFNMLSQKRYESYWEILKFAPFKRTHKKKVLEIGLGVGNDADEFVKNKADYYGVDLTSSSVNFVRERLKKKYNYNVNKLINCDSKKTPFKNNFFDIVYSFGVIHHSNRTEEIVQEIKRILKPGGKIFIMIYNRSSIFYLIEILIFRRLIIFLDYIPFFRKLIGFFLNNNRKIQIFNYLNRVSKRYSNRVFLTNQELLNSSSDHADCPLAKVYNRKETLNLFSEFKSVKTYTIYNEKADSIFWHLFSPVLNIFDKPLRKNFGWFRIVQAKK
jgi:ubiquinone/menaquinone biosynthesis C-methylase UbiE